MGLEKQIQDFEDLYKQAKDELPKFVGASLIIRDTNFVVQIDKNAVLKNIMDNIASLNCELTARKADIVSATKELK